MIKGPFRQLHVGLGTNPRPSCVAELKVSLCVRSFRLCWLTCHCIAVVFGLCIKEMKFNFITGSSMTNIPPKSRPVTFSALHTVSLLTW